MYETNTSGCWGSATNRWALTLKNERDHVILRRIIFVEFMFYQGECIILFTNREFSVSFVVSLNKLCM